ncbi:MAG: TIGR03643 family protein [Flammeovirgaceae bacterium]
MKTFDEFEINRIIEMAWEDRTPFEAIKFQFGINENDVIVLMRNNLTSSSFKHWRKHINGRQAKHLHKRGFLEGRHKSSLHRSITLNKISKKN